MLDVGDRELGRLGLNLPQGECGGSRRQAPILKYATTPLAGAASGHRIGFPQLKGAAPSVGRRRHVGLIGSRPQQHPARASGIIVVGGTGWGIFMDLLGLTVGQETQRALFVGIIVFVAVEGADGLCDMMARIGDGKLASMAASTGEAAANMASRLGRSLTETDEGQCQRR